MGWDLEPASGRWAEAIGNLYDAATSDGEPERILTPLREIAGGHTGVLCIFGPGELNIVNLGVPEEAIQAYAGRFGALDPWTRPTLAMAPQAYALANVGRSILAEGDLIRTEFFHDWARPFDLAEVIGGSMPLGAGRTAVYSTHRHWKGERFDDDDVRRTRMLVPHLQRALQLREQLGLPTACDGYAALDGLAFGMVVCDAAGRVSFANTAAEEAAGRGCGITLGASVSAFVPDDRRRLIALVQDACTGGSGGALTVRGGDDAVTAVLVAPLPRRFGPRPGLALLALRETERGPAAGVERLSSLFGLTPAESWLAAAIADGATLNDIMLQRGRTENTLRTQLSQVFRKTGTRTQAGLVRLIATLPPIR